jgi:hypothetical protein
VINARETKLNNAIEFAIKQHSDALMALTGVEGLGQGLRDGEPCIRVFVAAATPEVISQVRDILQGLPVDIEDTGDFQAFTGDASPRE